MRKAGFRYVFLGIENVLDDDLGFLQAQAKNARRENGRTAGERHRQGHRAPPRATGCTWSAGSSSAIPTTRGESIEANLDVRAAVRGLAVHPAPDALPPHADDPRARRRADLIVNEHLEEYDGTTAVVRTEHLSADEVEFLRWRAERWMKVRHLPAALAFNPGFVFGQGRRMLAHTFRGSSLGSLLGGRAERAAFERYRAIRRAEREYL